MGGSVGRQELSIKEATALMPQGRTAYASARAAMVARDTEFEFNAMRVAFDSLRTDDLMGRLEPPLTDALGRAVSDLHVDLAESRREGAIPAGRIVLDAVYEHAYRSDI